MTNREFQFRYDYSYQDGTWFHTAWSPLAAKTIKEAQAWIDKLDNHPTVKYRNVQVRRRTISIGEWKDV